MKGSILFAIACILTLSSTVNAATKCAGSDDCDQDLQFCTKNAGDSAWACPTGAKTGCGSGQTGGVAKAYADKKFCCKPGTAGSAPTASECDTTNVRWCGEAEGGSSCTGYNYCFRDKQTDGSGKTVCPTTETKNDACKDISDNEEKLIDGTKYCCKKAECPGTSTTRLTTPASNPPSKKDSGASGMQQNMAGLLTTTTAALFLSLLNP